MIKEEGQICKYIYNRICSLILKGCYDDSNSEWNHPKLAMILMSVECGIQFGLGFV
jgi:hypothetical protein